MEVTIDELHLNLKRFGIVKYPAPNRPQLDFATKIRYLQYCIFGAFYPNYFIRYTILPFSQCLPLCCTLDHFQSLDHAESSQKSL